MPIPIQELGIVKIGAPFELIQKRALLETGEIPKAQVNSAIYVF